MMLDANPPTLPPAWVGAAGQLSLVPEGRDSWSVWRDSTTIGAIANISDGDGPRWSIRVAGNEVAGVGRSWTSWEEALSDLADFWVSNAS